MCEGLSMKGVLDKMLLYLKVKVAQPCLTLCDPKSHGLSMEFSRPESWSG